MYVPTFNLVIFLNENMKRTNSLLPLKQYIYVLQIFEKVTTSELKF